MAAELIIPGLPDDIAMRCLARVPPRAHRKISRVCKLWKEVISSKIFQQMHRSCVEEDPGALHPFVILIDTSAAAERIPTSVNAYSFEISSAMCHRPSMCPTCFTNPHISGLRDSIFLSGCGLLTYHSRLFVFGGYTLGHVSNSLHIFDFLTSTWTLGSPMSLSRAEFAYGIIKNKIYVATGFFSTDDTQDPADFFTTAAEMYDIDANQWTPIANMPLSFKCDVSWTHQGKLFVRGCYFDNSGSRLIKVVSYNPCTNMWVHEILMCQLLCELNPISTIKIVSVGKDETLYMAEMKNSMYDSVDASFLEIKKLNLVTLTWDCVMRTTDYANHYAFSCEMMPKLNALKDGVLAILHGTESYAEFDAEEIEFLRSEEVVQMHMTCPYSCISVVLFL